MLYTKLNKESLFREFLDLVGDGKAKELKYWLELKNIDPSAENQLALHMAIDYGHTDVVKVLLADSRVDPLAKDRANPLFRVDAIERAAMHCHLDIILLLFAHPPVLAYMREKENLTYFINQQPNVKNALSTTHAEYNKEFCNAFLSLVNKDFNRKLSASIAMLHANGIPDELIANHIAPHMHPCFENYKDMIRENRGKKVIVQETYTRGYQI